MVELDNLLQYEQDLEDIRNWGASNLIKFKVSKTGSCSLSYNPSHSPHMMYNVDFPYRTLSPIYIRSKSEVVYPYHLSSKII